MSLKTIIVIAENSEDISKQSLDSMFKNISQNKTSLDYSLFYIDNSKETHLADKILSFVDTIIDSTPTLPKITVIKNDLNKPLYQILNFCISKSGKEDDVLIFKDNILYPLNWDLLIDNIVDENPDTGIFCFKQIDLFGNILPSAFKFNSPSLEFYPFFDEMKNLNQFSKKYDIFNSELNCIFIKKDILEKIKLTKGIWFDSNNNFFADFIFRTLFSDLKTSYFGNICFTNINFKLDKIVLDSKFSNKWESLFTNENFIYEVNIQGILQGFTGYGNATRLLIKNLEENNIKVNYSYLYGNRFSEPPLFKSFDLNLEFIRSDLSRKIKPGGIQIIFGLADIFCKNSGDYKIGYTMLETDRIPEEWVLNCNQMDEIWVPSEFNKETFLNSGVTVPIYVIPLFIDFDLFDSDVDPYPLKYKSDFNCFSLFEWSDRKNPLGLIEGFKTAFESEKNKFDSSLLIRYINRDPAVNIYSQLKNLNFNKLPMVQFLKNDINDQKNIFHLENYYLPSLYKTSDVSVSATCGEGYGYFQLESVLMGRPLITTGWSGYVEYLKDLPSVFFVDYDLKDIKNSNCPYYLNSKWALINRNDFIDKLIYVKDNLDKIKSDAKHSIEILKSKINPQVIMSKIKGRLKDITNKLERL